MSEHNVTRQYEREADTCHVTGELGQRGRRDPREQHGEQATTERNIYGDQQGILQQLGMTITLPMDLEGDASVRNEGEDAGEDLGYNICHQWSKQHTQEQKATHVNAISDDLDA